MLVATWVRKGSLIPEFAKNAVPSEGEIRICSNLMKRQTRTVEDEVDSSKLLPTKRIAVINVTLEQVRDAYAWMKIPESVRNKILLWLGLKQSR